MQVIPRCKRYLDASDTPMQAIPRCKRYPHGIWSVSSLSCFGDVADVEGNAALNYDADGTHDTDAKELLLEPACGDVTDISMVMSWAESPEKRLRSTSP